MLKSTEKKLNSSLLIQWPFQALPPLLSLHSTQNRSESSGLLNKQPEKGSKQKKTPLFPTPRTGLGKNQASDGLKRPDLATNPHARTSVTGDKTQGTLTCPWHYANSTKTPSPGTGGGMAETSRLISDSGLLFISFIYKIYIYSYVVIYS